MGSRVSHLLHQLVFSFPTPANGTSPSTFGKQGSSETTAALDEFFDEPGESRALAGGVGPLSFVGSGYGVMLVLMAILLNRIHHIVRRPRPPPPPLPHPPRRGLARLRHAISSTLTHPSTPQYLRLPGIFVLTRAWLLFTVLLLQVARVWPELNPSASGIFGRIGHWAGDMTMEKVCWQVFMGVCAGLACGGLANGLDRTRRRDFGAGFNLFGYSFLLHLYSSPLTHHHPTGTSTQPRPDVHALFQLWLGLTELAWIQAIELSPTLRNNLLLPTGICGTLGLGHFVYALATAPLKFPSFTFLTHLMALMLSIIILFSVVLKGITYLFTFGYIPSLTSLLPHEGVVPNIEDDFGITLLKIGTACIEATQYSGLRNELAVIEQHPAPWIEISASGTDLRKPFPTLAGGFQTEITNIEVAELADPHSENVYWREMRAFWRACLISANNFFWALILATPVGRKAVEMGKKALLRRWWYGPRQWRVWRMDAWREPPLAVARRRIAQRVQEVQEVQLRREARRNQRSRAAAHSPTPEPSSATSSAVQLHQRNREAISYNRFLLGQADIEDDEDDWVDDASSTSSSHSWESEEEEQSLYRDLVARPDIDNDDEDDIQPVLLAHLTSRTATPLTRRRYAALLANRSPTPSSSMGLQEVIQERRTSLASQPRDEDDEERRKACVVCMTQMRDTILWPCRCLALCNDCRDSLASRLTASEHMCPCCRRKVEGYSRIYIP
ncbi:hypothetical protein IAT40_007687 [Kwoniella sp. CBS 6097]